MNRALALFILLLSVGRLPSFSFRWTLYEVSRSYPPFSCNVFPFLSWPLSSLSLVVFSPSDLRAPLPFPFDFFSTSSFLDRSFLCLVVFCALSYLLSHAGSRYGKSRVDEFRASVRLCFRHEVGGGLVPLQPKLPSLRPSNSTFASATPARKEKLQLNSRQLPLSNQRSPTMLGLRAQCLVRPFPLTLLRRLHPPPLWLTQPPPFKQVADNSGALVATIINVLRHGPYSHATVG